jgi:hypothetical protein
MFGTGLKGARLMNAGFFILAPSLPAFEYYKSLPDAPYSLDPNIRNENIKTEQ